MFKKDTTPDHKFDVNIKLFKTIRLICKNVKDFLKIKKCINLQKALEYKFEI